MKETLGPYGQTLLNLQLHLLQRVIPIRLSVKDPHEPFCGLGGL